MPLDDSVDDPHRRRWLHAQAAEVCTTAERLAGVPIAFVEEIERCYGVTPRFVDEEAFAGAHQALEEVLPGSGPLPERYIA